MHGSYLDISIDIIRPKHIEFISRTYSESMWYKKIDADLQK